MPKLNRIRLANISYDGKYITDQIFDTYGGENTLLNLANGSGKSVLVQMVLQPILPCQRIHERKIDYYLSQTASPSYIMLEWILDHTIKPIYYLTGIAMCSIPQDDESGSRVKYFTFTHKYDAATDYDVAHTPLILLNSGGGHRFMPYDEAFNMLKNVKSDLHPLHCFAKDRKEFYYRELEEHGIFPEEWKLMARVNDKEGGVDEVFSACKSSDALLNKWILKTITDKTKQEEQNLREMFFELIWSILAQEETILEKELLSGFLSELGKLIDTIANLSQHLDCIEQIERLLAGVYHYIKQRLNSIDEEKHYCAANLDELGAAKQQIHYEEVSASWHRANTFLLKQNSRLEEQSVITEVQRALSDKAKRDKEALEAAGHTEKLCFAQAHIANLREQLEKIKTGHGDEDTADVLYSLHQRYSEAIGQSQKALEKMVAELEMLEDSSAQYKNDIAKIELKKQEIAGKLGALAQKISAFLSYEAQCLSSLGLTIHRTLFGALNLEEQATAKQQVEGHLKQLQQQAETLALRLEAAIQRRQDLASSQTRLRDDLDEIKTSLHRQKLAIEQYEKSEKSLNEINGRQGLSKYIKDIPRNLVALHNSAVQRKTELAKLEARLVYERDTLAHLAAFCLHTSAEFGRLLESKGIVYITGENYLKDMDEKQQKTILSHNPMLPFCFLVGKSDFALATSLYSPGLDRICPVLILEKAEEDIKAGEHGVALTDFGWAMCYYYEESFAPATKDIFKDKLEAALAQTEKSCAEWQAELEQLKFDIQFVEGFPYTDQSKRLLDEVLNALITKRRIIEECMENETREALELESLCGVLQKSITENQAAMANSRHNIQLFQEYLEKNDSYMQDYAEQQQLIQVQKELIRQSQQLQEDIEGYNNKITSFSIEKAQLSTQLDILGLKLRQINPPSSGVMLDWLLETLENRYEEIKAKQTQDERIVMAEISHHQEKRHEAEKALKKYRHIQEYEIEGITYSENQLEYVEKESKRLKQLWQEADNELKTVEKAQIRAKAECDSCLNRIREEGWQQPLDLSEISGDFEARRHIIQKKQTELNKKIQELEQTKEKCQHDISRILRVIEDLAPQDIAAPAGGWQVINIEEQARAHKDLAGKISNLREQSGELEHALKNSFQGHHTGIDHILGHLTLAGNTYNYEACYFIFERLSEQSKLMQETLRVLESHLKHLDKQKDNVVFHAFAQGKRLHGELKKISESSRVKLAPDKPPRQTLKIAVPDELDPYANQRISDHINACVSEMRQLKKENALSEKTMQSLIDTKLSDREILNQLIGQHSIDVRLLKVDISQANSTLRTWERVLTDNSGGELFVSCFVLLAALMDYARHSVVPDEKAGGGMKVMLIDNPFGKTSSEHLLDALIQVAGQFKMQLICLSDLSQSSITAKFALIYQLSLRPSLYSGKAYLKVDSLTSKAPLVQNSRLDHVSLKHEQISMF